MNIVLLKEVTKRVKVAFVGTCEEDYRDKNNPDAVPMIRTADLCDFISSFDNMKYISRDFHLRNKKSQLHKGDILIARHGENGKACIYNSDREANCLNVVIIEPDNTKLNYKYLKYAFDSSEIKAQIKGNLVGSVQSVINTKSIENLFIHIPSIKKQENVIKILSSLDDKIDLNNRINAKLEQMAKRLYDYWFVQFDFPGADGKPYKSNGGKMVWNEEHKREIPELWEVKKLGDVTEIVLGGTPSTQETSFWNQGTINWLNSGEVGEFPIVTSEKKITEIAMQHSSTEFLKAGAVTLSITRYLRPSILAIDACINQSVVGLKENKILKNCFMYPYLQNEVDRLMSLRTGAQQPHINKETVEESYICVPTEEIMDEYNKRAQPIYNQIISVAKQNKKLTKMRDKLLPLLMNGQVVVE